ncbi:MAG TPA: hypothetical protein PLN52_26110 [Opitutaceae bacterium]|nr:hypothetical protein [Opitutaceae bacterium]
MSTETLTVTFPVRLSAAVRLDALTQERKPEELVLDYAASSFHHGVMGFMHGWSEKEVEGWMLKESPAQRRLRMAEALLRQRAYELASAMSGALEQCDAATNAWTEATNAFIEAHKRAYPSRS